VLVVADMGNLGAWSGDEPPDDEPPGDEPDTVTGPGSSARVAGVRDLRVEGPDAEPAARELGLQPFTWLYDIPDHALDEVHDCFDEVVKQHGLTAELVEEPARVPHLTRALRAAAQGGGGFQVDGLPVVAMPAEAGVTLPVVATVRDYGGVVGERWERVEARVPGASAATGREVGAVGVDWARLIFADAHALGSWVHEDSLDGLADVAFWGRDANEAAAVFAAGRIPDGVHGWSDLPLLEAAQRTLDIERWVGANDRRLVCDFRPHSHHYHVMAQVRAAERGFGAIDVGGARMLGFETTWGDGLFPVEVDSDDAGRVSCVRVRLGDEARRARTERVLARA
jgi:hypothetical protein